MPPAPAQFDDGLAEIARLIEREYLLAGDAEVRPKTSSKDKASNTYRNWQADE